MHVRRDAWVLSPHAAGEDWRPLSHCPWSDILQKGTSSVTIESISSALD